MGSRGGNVRRCKLRAPSAIWKYACTLWKFGAENHTENFDTLKLTLKNSIKEALTENFTEKLPLLFGNEKIKKQKTFT